MRPAVAELKKVSKTFGRGVTLVEALRSVDLEIHAGELTLIEGPSGSGKTTLLHILGLLQEADEGEVWIRGRRMDQVPEHRLPDERANNVVLIFQGYNLLDSLTVRDNVAVAGRLTAGSYRATPVADYLGRLGLQGRTGHLPGQLSGGEKQRTAIARALACPGSLVLADEPTANLDWTNAQQVVQCLADFAHREQRAVVMVSHDSRLEPFVDRIVNILNGRISDDRRTGADPMDQTSERMTAERHSVRRGSVLAKVVIGLGFCVLGAIAGVLGYRYLDFGGTKPAEQTGAGAESVTPYVAAAPAVVEPSTQLVSLRSERRGRIEAVLKRANDPIVRGETLVLLDEAIPQALVEQRRADLALAKANLTELEAWDRPEVRAKAKAGVDSAEARLERAESELKRVQSLYADTAAPSAELDRAIEEKKLSAAALEEARQTQKMSEAGPTPTEIGVAQARVAQAEAVLRLAETELDLCTITSPLDGHVIYRHQEPGEVVDPEVAVPILSLGNLDEVRLRAEVDEADIERVRLGQLVIATAEAYGDRKFTGRVVHLEPTMGRKTIRTERTTEQQDAKVREVLIELAGGTPSLPIDLQMTVRFLATPDQGMASSPATSRSP